MENFAVQMLDYIRPFTYRDSIQCANRTNDCIAASEERQFREKVRQFGQWESGKLTVISVR